MPEAILLQDVDQLGAKGTVVDVSKGYLRNFLIPRHLAQPATKGALEVARRVAEAQQRAAEHATSQARESADLLNNTFLTLTPQAGEAARLFGSVTAQDITDAIKE